MAVLLRPASTNFIQSPKPNSCKPKILLQHMMMMSSTGNSNSSPFPTVAVKTNNNNNSKKKKLPVLLFDVMDTLVRDPFYHDIPAFFQMSMKELLECKHPNAWVEFEKGSIDETELAKIFFKDGRPFDLEGLKECIARGYSYIDGMEALLHSLKQNNYELHAFTNYPIWYKIIEEKLRLSKYLSWTFCSCKIGKRKPAPDSYMDVLHQLGVEPANCVFIDDRIGNVEAAANAGMVGLHFKNADLLKQDLFSLGIEINIDDSPLLSKIGGS